MPTATRQPTSQPTSQPTNTPSPTPPPSVRLETGRWLQSIGDCAGARRELAAVVATSDQPAHIAEARYRLAQCYLAEDAAAEAAAVLAQMLTTAVESDPYRPPATFLLGETLAGLGRWADAEASYREYLPLAPELAALTWQRIAAMRRAAGDLPAAVEAYTNALAESPDWESTVASRRGLANLAVAQGQGAAAAAQYDALRGAATTGAWAAEMYYLAGQALAIGVPTATTTITPTAPAEALRRWQAATDADPTSAYAYRAMAALVDVGAAVDEFQRGLVNYHNRAYRLAIAAFDRYRGRDPNGREGQADYYTGLSYLALGETAAGISALERFIAAFSNSPLWADAWLAKARGRRARARRPRPPPPIAAWRSCAPMCPRPRVPCGRRPFWMPDPASPRPARKPTWRWREAIPRPRMPGARTRPRA